MAKMFYSLEEAAAQLGISEEQVTEMAATGELQQFRDRDKLMFKREQIDALAAEASDDSTELGDLGSTLEDYVSASDGTIPLIDDDNTSSDEIHSTTDTDVIDLISGDPEVPELAVPQPDDDAEVDDDTEAEDEASTDTIGVDTSELEIDLEDGSSHAGLLDPGANDIGTVDLSGMTQITDTSRDILDEDEELALEQVGSGSGLLDLSRETDDTSLGAELLDEIYPSGQQGGAGRVGSELEPVGVGEGSAQMAGHDDDDEAFTSSNIFSGSVELDISTSGLENLQDMGEPSSVVPSVMIPQTTAMPEVVDQAGSGMTAGAFTVALVALLLALVVVIYGVAGVPSSLTGSMSSHLPLYCVGLIVLALVLGGVGMVFGKTQQK
jgi:excisionase family DNA binding protein